MNSAPPPILSELDIQEGLFKARSSPRHRYPKLLHKPGDESNRVFNFIMRDSYMQPHMHPGDEKIEEILLIKGRIAILFFDDSGNVVGTNYLKKEGIDSVSVPAFTWHTYVMLSDEVVTYETMMGKYDPMTWKRFAVWAPEESSTMSLCYLASLKAKFEL
jgi:cupin fold WbuC family metalloprotein